MNRVIVIKEVSACAACVVFGILIATLPHVVSCINDGSCVWVADNDEVFYLQVGSQAYFNHPFHLADPVRVAGGHSIYKPLPLLPGELIARGLRLGPILIGLCWRFWSGLTIGIAWYLLWRVVTKRIAAAVLLTFLCLSDGGLMEGRPVWTQVRNAVRVIRADAMLFATKPILHPEWRISTPGVTMAYLIAAILCVWRARELPNRSRLLLAGAAYGLLFHVYFYYWTAITIALGLCFLCDIGHRRVYFHTSWIGILVGLPSLIADFITKNATASDWLHRTDKFLPIGHFSELLIPKGAIVALLLLGCFVYTRRQYLFVFFVAVAGILLSNHQVVTGLQIENFHWNFVWGPALSILILMIIKDWLCPKLARLLGKAGLGLVVALLLVCGLGVWLRVVEATQTRESRELTRLYHALSQKCDHQFTPNAIIAAPDRVSGLISVIANVRPLSGYAATLSSALLTTEWDQRRALNAVLTGLDRAEFEAQELAFLRNNHWGPWSRNEDLLQERLRQRLKAYDDFSGQLKQTIRDWRVGYVITDPGRVPPPAQVWKPHGKADDPCYWERSMQE